MLYTGNPSAAASRFIVPPPLITRSEYHMRLRPSTTWSGMTAFFASNRRGHCARISRLLLVPGQDHHGGFLHGAEVVHDLAEELFAFRVVVMGLRGGGANRDDEVLFAQSQFLQDGGVGLNSGT